MRKTNHGDLDGAVHRHRGAAARGERNAAHGTIRSISGTSFVLAATQGELTVTTSADTDSHSPRQAREANGEHLTFAALKVSQRLAVQGERPNDATLLARRVHIPNP